MAMTAWSAKVWSSAMCLSENGTHRRVPDRDRPDRAALAEHGHRQRRSESPLRSARSRTRSRSWSCDTSGDVHDGPLEDRVGP